jgi:DNA-binding response OmpR family regulator
VLAGRLDVAHCADTDLDALLDRMPLPDIELIVVACNGDADDAHRACRSVRAITNTPLAMLTSSRREADELLAFARGCDDYITTSSSPEVIRARLEVLAARGGCHHEQVVEFGTLSVDPSLRVASVDGIPIALTRTEFDLLHALVTSQRRVIPRRELLEVGWGGCPPSDHVLDVHLSRLRRKVLQAGGPRIGVPVPGVGYRVGSPDPAPETLAAQVSQPDGIPRTSVIRGPAVGHELAARQPAWA